MSQQHVQNISSLGTNLKTLAANYLQHMEFVMQILHPRIYALEEKFSLTQHDINNAPLKEPTNIPSTLRPSQTIRSAMHQHQHHNSAFNKFENDGLQLHTAIPIKKENNTIYKNNKNNTYMHNIKQDNEASESRPAFNSNAFYILISDINTKIKYDAIDTFLSKTAPTLAFHASVQNPFGKGSLI